jgi:hypothetical protein
MSDRFGQNKRIEMCRIELELAVQLRNALEALHSNEKDQALQLEGDWDNLSDELTQIFDISRNILRPNTIMDPFRDFDRVLHVACLAS